MNAVKFEITLIVLLVCLVIVALSVLGCEGMARTSLTIQQTTDPISGAPINQDIFTMYKGKAVYFSSEENKQEFLNDPGKYVNNLPQFKGEEKTGSYLISPRNISGDNY